MTNLQMQPLTADQIVAFHAIADKFIHHANDRIWLTKRPRWTAVPVESALHFDDSDIERIMHAVTGNEKCYILLLEALTGIPDVAMAPANRDGFRIFNEQYGHFKVALLPQDFSWLIACSTDDYFVVEGEERFVSAVVDMPIARALEKFQNFACDPNWSERTRNVLVTVSDCFKVIYPALNDFDEVCIETMEVCRHDDLKTINSNR